MDKTKILQAIKQVRESSTKKKFNQTFDLTFNLRGLNLKKLEHKIDVFVLLPHGRGKKRKICALIDDVMFTEAKTVFDRVILKSDFKNLAPKDVKKIAGEYDYFVAQANIMGELAGTFGKILGVRGKMPNPKSGAIVPPKTALKPVYDKLQKTVRLITKGEPTIKCAVGTEDMKDEDIADNVFAVYNAFVSMLPEQSKTIKTMLLKLTMSKPVAVGN